MVGQGIYTTKSDAAKWIRENSKTLQGANTFDTLQQNQWLSANASKSAYQQQYEEDVSKAYISAMANRSAILSSGLGTGAKQAMLSDTDIALEDAYNAAVSKLAQNKASVDEQLYKAYSETESEINKEAANYLKAQDYVFDYLSYLDTYMQGLSEEQYNKFINDPMWSRYYTSKKVGPGEQDVEYVLKSRKELSEPMYDPETGDWVSVYGTDDNGNIVLTDYGRDFFDKVLNYQFTGLTDEYGNKVDVNTYADYLAEKDINLYNWLNEENPYSYSPSSVYGNNTRMGMFKQMSGLKSTDNTYTYAEQFRNSSKKEKQELLDQYINSKLGTSNTIKTRYESNSIKYELNRLFGNDLSVELYDYSTLSDMLDAYNEYSKLSGVDLGDLNNIRNDFKNIELELSKVNEARGKNNFSNVARSALINSYRWLMNASVDIQDTLNPGMGYSLGKINLIDINKQIEEGADADKLYEELLKKYSKLQKDVITKIKNKLT